MKSIDGGLLIMFEGSDGVGKTTQLEKAAEALSKDGWDVYKTRNLGGTPIGEALRQVSFSHLERPAETDLYISVAIQEALTHSLVAERKQRRIILIDRGPLSLAVYQIYGSGVDEKLGWQHADKGMSAFAPELVILYTADVKTALERARKHSKKADYFESKPLSYFERVEEGFKVAAKRHPVKFINANQSIEAVHKETMALINREISEKLSMKQA